MAIWQNDLQECVESLDDGSDRVLVTRIHTSEGDLVVINTYMPTDRTHSDADYNSLLDEVYEIFEKYSQTAKILWLGDMNASPERNKYKNDKLFTVFCKDNSLIISPLSPNKPTYHHFDGKRVSKIDYFVHSIDENFIERIEIDIRNSTNTSTHDSLTATLKARKPAYNSPADLGYQITNQCKARIQWHKVNIEKYKEITGKRL